MSGYYRPDAAPVADMPDAVTCTGLDGCACPTCTGPLTAAESRRLLSLFSSQAETMTDDRLDDLERLSDRAAADERPRPIETATPAPVLPGTEARHLLARGVATGSNEDVLAAGRALAAVGERAAAHPGGVLGVVDEDAAKGGRS